MKDGEGYMPNDHVLRKYELAKNDYPHYNDMQANGTHVIGVWDDHDYGVNDGGNQFVHKHANREIFLDFIGEPEDSPRR